jgi:hypothetical protein
MIIADNIHIPKKMAIPISKNLIVLNNLSFSFITKNLTAKI